MHQYIAASNSFLPSTRLDGNSNINSNFHMHEISPTTELQSVTNVQATSLCQRKNLKKYSRNISEQGLPKKTLMVGVMLKGSPALVSNAICITMPATPSHSGEQNWKLSLGWDFSKAHVWIIGNHHTISSMVSPACLGCTWVETSSTKRSNIPAGHLCVFKCARVPMRLVKLLQTLATWTSRVRQRPSR